MTASSDHGSCTSSSRATIHRRWSHTNTPSQPASSAAAAIPTSSSGSPKGGMLTPYRTADSMSDLSLVGV